MDFDVILDGGQQTVLWKSINPSYKGTKQSGQDTVPWKLWMMLQENL